jgi:hypothetical protein
MSESSVAVLTSGKEQCLSLEGGSMLRFSNSLVDCGPPIAVAENRALCSPDPAQNDDCQDLGTIQCCLSNEYCGDGGDDDCDGLFDEGCECGGVLCASDTPDRCCADTQCGSRPPEAPTSCLSTSGAIPSAMCSTAMVPLSGELVPAAGCCITGLGECGAIHATYGCVSMTDSIAVWGPGAMINPSPCTQ